MRILAALLLAAAPTLADEPNVAGAYENDADGLTYLSTQRGRCPEGMRMVLAVNANQAVVGNGCYGLHNGLSVVILWQRGPATVVPISSVTWRKQAPGLES